MSARAVTALFIVSIIASLVLVVFYFVGDSVQVEGVLLALALGSMGAAIVGWATSLMGAREGEEERGDLASSDEELDEVAKAFGSELSRRSLLIRLLAGAGATLGAALAIPALSLGPRPGESLFRTKWAAGKRIVTSDGTPLKPFDVPFNGIVTAFPEGSPGDAESQTVVISLDRGLLELSEDRMEGVVEGVVAFSKICTHAGCPVGLYRAQSHQLLCPCHQSTFDVLRGCEPIFGPTARPLPQLPLDLDDEGFLIATGDFSEPAGPSFWNLYRRPDA